MQLQHSLVKIGTSGIVVPGAKRDYPPEFQSGSQLHYYGSLFNTLEINTCFYKIPMPKTFAKLAAEVPDDFVFTVKLWRGITHAKKLEFSLDDIDVFMHAANQLGEKKGCVLIQFPASITFSYQEKVEAILQRLDQLNELGQWQLAVEVRHTSWYQSAAYGIFEKYKAALVFHDMPNSKTPFDYLAMQHVYCRFHGPTGKYNGSYSPEFIQDLANHIKLWCENKKTVYVYFNNTIDGALGNAQTLQELM